MTVSGTPTAERCERVLLARFGANIDRVGQYKRRPISGKSTWSQHSWANALDVHVDTLAEGDEIYDFLIANRRALGVRYILWRRPDHWDHIHVDFWPKGSGTPPTSVTGVGRFTNRDGTVVWRKIQAAPLDGDYELQEEEAVALKNGSRGPAVLKLQRSVNVWRPRLNIDEDGVYGPQTESAVRTYQAAAGLDETGMADGVTLSFLFDNARVDEPASGLADPTARAAAAAAKARADTAHDRIDGVSLEVPA